jgi:hypothetical protein
LTAYLFTTMVLTPHVLEPMCLVNTGNCTEVTYLSYANSALVLIEPSGYWVWYNGVNAYVYPPLAVTEFPCQSADYEAAYLVPPVTALPQGLECIKSLESVQQYYSDKGAQPETFYMRPPADGIAIGLRDVLNKLGEKGIIKFV